MLLSELEKLRSEIDSIDRKIVELFESRMNTVEKIADVKLQQKIGILNSSREENVINKGLSLLGNKEYSKELEEFLKTMMQLSKNVQQRRIRGIGKEGIRIGFQGVRGSFGHQAATEYFGEEADAFEYMEFEDVFCGLAGGEIQYGVIPIENSSTGSINSVYDLIGKYGFHIVGEICLKIKQNLMGIRGSKIEDIKEVYSHSQGFQQSSTFLKRHPGWKLIPYHNTAYSAKFVSQSGDMSKAAIAGENAAKIYGLQMIESGINDNESNYTRFVVIGREMTVDSSSDKISTMFSIKHRAGELYRALESFHSKDVNMLKIESRPIKNRPWEYMFYVDFEGNVEDEKVKEAMDVIRKSSSHFRLLGNYKSHGTLR